MLSHPCVVYTSHLELLENQTDIPEQLTCELQGDDRRGKNYAWVTIHGIPSRWDRMGEIKSGVTTLFARNAEIHETSGQLIIPTGENIKVRVKFILHKENHDPSQSPTPSNLLI